jgi:hypothetical protein
VNVFKESVRDKVLYSIVGFALVLISASFLLGQITAGQDLKIIKDLGLASISTFGLFIAVFIGIGARVEGGRTSEHLQSAVEADWTVRIRAGQVSAAWCSR